MLAESQPTRRGSSPRQTVGAGAGSSRARASSCSEPAGHCGPGSQATPADREKSPPKEIDAKIKEAAAGVEPENALYAVLEECDNEPFFQAAVLGSLLAMIERGETEATRKS